MKTRIASYLGAALALVGVWFFLLFAPLHKEQASMAAQTVEAQRQLDDFRRIMNELPGFLEALENLRAQKAVLSSKLYTKGDILKLFEELNQQAQKGKLTIVEISPPIDELLYLNSIVPDSNQPQFLNISLKLEGGYISFGRFIGRVEQSNYFRGISDCKIVGTKTGEGDIQLQLGFKALLGSFKERV